jgi:RNA polymerase sigma-70 factor (ECF subfamily)
MYDEPGTSAAEFPSFEEIYKRCQTRVYHYCLLQTHDATLAEDIAAQTFMAAYRAYDKRRPEPETVHLWLFRIARNLTHDHHRKERRSKQLLQMLGRNDDRVGSIEASAEVNADLARVLAVMAKMKERDSRLIALRAAGDLSFREIGEIVGMSEASVTVATHRAYERFRRLNQEMP